MSTGQYDIIIIYYIYNKKFLKIILFFFFFLCNKFNINFTLYLYTYNIYNKSNSNIKYSFIIT